MIEYIEFEVLNKDKFKQLQTIFLKIKNDKEADIRDEDEVYLALLDHEVRQNFWWPTPKEIAEWAKQWQKMSIDERLHYVGDEKWDFSSILEAFFSGDYMLLSCEMITSYSARLNFETWGWPYGGTGCMQALIKSFGFKILLVADGSQSPYTP